MRAAVRAGHRRALKPAPAQRLPAPTQNGVPELDSVRSVLALQHSHGNQAVLRLLQRNTGAPIVIQRLPEATAFAGSLARVGQRYGGKGLGNIIDQLRAYHLERKAMGATLDKKKLGTTLTRLIEMCNGWLQGFPKNLSAKEDLANKTAVSTLATDAAKEQRFVETGKQEQAEEEEEPEIVIPPLPAQRGTKLEDRLDWMDIKAQQADATKEQREARETIAKAKSELKRVVGRQKAQMKADDATNSADKQWWQEKASGYKIGSGELALSFMLGKLFTLFGFTPLAFQNRHITDPQKQMLEFSTKARQLFGELILTSTDGMKKMGPFKDVILVVAGSSTLGYSSAKGTDFGPQSDVDLGVASSDLLTACRAAGAQIRGANDRTEPDPLPDIKAISQELQKLVPYDDKSGTKANRKVSIMVYKSRAAAQRQPGVELP